MRVVRWVIAGVLLVVAVVVAPAVERLVWSWGYDQSHPGDRQDLLSHVRDLPSGGLFVWLALLVVLIAVNLRWPLNWPRVALLGTVPIAVFQVLAELVDLALRSTAPGLYLAWILGGGLGSAVVAWGAAKLAVLVVTRPLSPDVIQSGTELVYRLRDGSRLRLQGDKLLLDLLLRPGSSVTAMRLTIPYKDLALVQPGVLDSHAQLWPLPNGSVVVLSPGSSLRVVGSGQQWVLPLDDASDVAEIVTERARAHGRLVPSDAAQGTLPDAPESLPTKRFRPWHTSPWPFDIAVLAALALAGASVDYAITEDPLGWITFVLCLALVAGGVRLLRKVRATRDQAEANPRPADAEPWGDYAPTRVPLPGWSPVPTGLPGTNDYGRA
ncbi:hypothetical protein JOF56_006560 [Kibdelosporangium banguiense]|uniref:Uncharacterized protein n=1 Tax=Kibdelosporangium banguiense TaxID=1365924 RepID=A0ABS4TP43_9PSEU|nr:hypothetical protein [Kibdelosporangium banguiense]MBP2326175.1 hypothetical protein [Kibdelosporangium banguiense]